MNANTFRLVFSKHLGMLVPVGEQTATCRKPAGGQRAGGGRKSAAFLLNVLALSIAAVLPAPTFALPTGPSGLVGLAPADIVTSGQVMTITTASQKSIASWQSFSIDAGQTLNIIQPSVTSHMLNQVIGKNPSDIYGTLSSNGKVWLVNQAGIVVGAGAVIDTAGFVASTLNVRAEDFLAGRLAFQATPGAGDVVNRGSITTPQGGSVYLVGTNVANEGEGIITTPGGETILAAGNTVSLVDTATPGVKVEITGDANNATNLGTIVAAAGRIGIAGSIVKNSGTLNASSVVSEGGRIFLKANQDTYVDGHGRIVATGTKGGQVEVLGNRVAVTDNAEIDASGTTGGGTIRVGGDYQGKNPDVQNAQVTYFGAEATIKADAIENGDGGKVILWADDATRAHGNISARGGANGGNGGFVEVSGKQYLEYRAKTDLRAPVGLAGTLLLDPTSVTIVANSPATDSGYDAANRAFYGSTPGAATYLTWADIQTALGGGNLIVYAQDSGSGYITVSESPNDATGFTLIREWGNWTTNNVYNSANKLSLLADGQVHVNAGFGNRGTGAIDIMAGWNGNLATPDVDAAFNDGKNIFINAQIATNGALTLKAGDTVLLDNDGGQYASIEMNAGALNITADKLILDASVSTLGGFTPGVRIASSGNQTFNIGRSGGAGVLALTGNSAATAYGGTAGIDRYYNASSTGGQVFNLHYGADVTLTAGSGDGIYDPVLNNWSGDCTIAAVCSSNSAELENEGLGGQIFNATAPGTIITLTGGGVGNNNGAWIDNELGTQRIQGSVEANRPTLNIFGGATGGSVIAYGGELEHFDNGASVSSDAGQVIEVATLTMTGGAAEYGGAYLGGRTQDIKVTGNVALTGGGIAAPGVASGTGEMIFKSGAFIGGDDESGTTHSLTLTVGGDLTMAGGPTGEYGGSPAAIGSYGIPVNATINVYGGVAMNGIGPGYDRIGTWGGLGGTVILRSGLGGTGEMNLGKGWIGTGTTGSVTLVAGGTGAAITQDALGAIMTATLNASTLTSIGSINLQGVNKVNNFTASAENVIAFKNTQSFTASSVTATSAANGAVTLTSLNGGNISLGTISAGYGATINASGAIYETNGVRNTDITAGAGGVGLFSQYGGLGGSSLAISADIATSGPVQSRVYNSGGSDNGGIRIYNTTATAPTSVWLQDDAANYTGISYYNTGNLTTGAGFSLSTLNGGDIKLGSGGNLTLGAGTPQFGTTGTAYLSAVGTLDVGAAYSQATGNLSLVAGGALNVSNAVAATVGDVTLRGSTVNINDDVSALAGTVQLSGGNLNVTTASMAADDITANFSGDIRLNNGSVWNADYGVYLDLTGAASTLYLNDTVDQADPSEISVAYGGTIEVEFLQRSSGGIVIDGVQTAQTTADSGFYIDGTPAVPGAGLVLAYAPPTAATNNPVTNQVVSSVTTSTTTTRTTSSSTAPLAPTTTTTTTSSPMQQQTVGGEEGTFGSSSSSTSSSTSGSSTAGGATGESAESGESTGGEAKEDKKEAKQEGAAEKKEDKPAAKKYATCA